MSLSQKVIEKITTPGNYQDRNGLILKVRPSGSKSWILRYQVNGERHDMGLGSFPGLSLAEARKKAIEQRALINQGVDPLEQKKRKRHRIHNPQRRGYVVY